MLPHTPMPEAMRAMPATDAGRARGAGGHVPRRLAIASPQATGTEAGAAVFAAGGNAFDAAVAAALALTVAYPSDCALGGDLIALVRRADGRRVVINASGPAAAATDVGALRARGDAMPVTGAETVTAPGLIAGLRTIWEFGGRLTWQAAFEHAFADAVDGVVVTPSLAAALAEAAQALAGDEGMRAVFLPGGRPLAAGDTLRQPALARTLETLASDGPEAFYGGPIGASFVARLAALGSPPAEEDLARFRPEVVAPLTVDVGGRELATAPPNSQGYLLPLMLLAAEGIDPELDPLGPRADELAAVFAKATRRRDRELGDPRSMTVTARDLVDPSRLRDEWPPGRPRASGSGDTVAVVAADDHGNAVSLIQSLFHAFGAGIMDPATGIIAHNRGSFFSLDPSSPNVIAGGKRPAHTLAPCMVFQAGRPTVVAGTMGGGAQPQILAQVLRRLAMGAAADAAVDAPRWIVGGMGADSRRDEILLEARVPPDARRALARCGLPLTELGAYDDGVGHVQVITIGRAGELLAASDPRSEGAAIVRSVGS